MSKRLWVLPVLVAMLLVLGSGFGMAMPSLGGFTGIVTVPNALVAPMGQVQVAASYQKLSGTIDEAVVNNALINTIGMYLPSEDNSAWSLQALAGVADGAELWAAYARDNSDFENSVWDVGGKIQIPMEGQTGWNLAVGASYGRLNGDASFVDALGFYTDVDNEIKNINAFLVATADLTAMGQSEWAGGTRVLGTIGMMYKKADADVEISHETLGAFTASGDESLFRPFVGVEFLGEERTSLGLEYRWKDSDLDAKAVFSAVLKHQFEQGFDVEVGTTNADLLGFGGDDQNWFARVGYSFGMK